MPKFAIGDKVIVVDKKDPLVPMNSAMPVGSVHEVVGFGNMGCLKLRGEPMNWDERRFEKVEEEPMAKFKVDDRVKFVPESWSPSYRIGMVGVVENYKPANSQWPYQVRLEEENHLLPFVGEDEMELVPTVTHAFKVGDKVHYKSEPNVVYTILKLGERSDHYYIEWSSSLNGDHMEGKYPLLSDSYTVLPEPPKLTRAKAQEAALLKLHTELWDSRGTVIDDPDGFGYGDLRYQVLTGAIDSVVLALNALREEK